MLSELATPSRYYECPRIYAGPGPAVFLAGGITGCPDWQSEVRSALDGVAIDVLNPRREDFPIDDPEAARGQIAWEHAHLRAADAVLFWFPSGAVQPIALYELGAWSMTDKPLFVGTARDYERRLDVVVQTHLARPDVVVRDNLGDVMADAMRHLMVS